MLHGLRVNCDNTFLESSLISQDMELTGACFTLCLNAVWNPARDKVGVGEMPFIQSSVIPCFNGTRDAALKESEPLGDDLSGWLV